jgi:hypothetical protein
MNRFEEILNSAINRTKNGESIDTVISSYPQEVRYRLKSLLQITQDFNSLPRVNIPKPSKRYSYAAHPFSQRKGLFAFNIFQNVYVASFMVLLFGLSSTAYATFMSLPGDSFFALKKGVESVQLKFTTDPVSKADFKLSLATKRLEEAQQVIYTEQNDENKNKAIEELNKQTTEALNEIQEIASNPEVASNPKMAEKIQKAESLAKSQNTLVAVVNPNGADSSNKAIQEKITTIKQVIATSLEQTNAAIPSLVKIEKTSAIKLLKGNTLTLEDGTIFEVDKDQVTITNLKSEKIALKDLAIGDYVKIDGNTKENINYAISITIVQKPKPAEVKEEDTKAPTDSKDSAKPADEKPTNSVPIKKPAEKPVDNSNSSAPNQNPIDPIVEKPQDTYGGFILEPVTNPTVNPTE